jgi:excisionase family DNA binding protein
VNTSPRRRLNEEQSSKHGNISKLTAFVQGPPGQGGGDTPGGERPGLLTAREVAKRLRVSVRTVRDLAALGELPAYKVGRQWRFDENDVQTYLHHTRFSLGDGDNGEDGD